LLRGLEKKIKISPKGTTERSNRKNKRKERKTE